MEKMSRFKPCWIGAMVCLIWSGCKFTSVTVDVIVHHAKIYTVNEEFTVAQAMAIKDGKIVAIGAEREILNAYDAPVVYDMQGKCIYPGFTDAHAHFMAFGLFQQECDLNGLKSWNEIVEKIGKSKPCDGWIIGRGWDQNLWQDKELPNKEQLDKLYPNTPVWLIRVDGHAGIANSSALRLAKITSDLKVNGGVVGKDLHGELTGILVDNAMALMEVAMPKKSKETKIQAIIQAQKKCFEVGLTGITEAGMALEDIELMQSLSKNGILKMPMYILASPDTTTLNHFLKVGIDTSNMNLVIRGFKYYADGALGSRGACLLNPYVDLLSHGQVNYGALLGQPTVWINQWSELARKNFQVCTHAIGDSANRVVLKGYHTVLKEVNDKRWRVEHAQVVDPWDIHWFSDCSILASVQPTHATSDAPWAWERLGKNRMIEAYKYKTLLEANGMLVLGTDFPIEDIDPLNTFFSAVWRKDRQLSTAQTFQKSEAISREEAIRGMTIWNAIARFEENKRGSLEVGKEADFVVCNGDLMEIEEDQFNKINVEMTFIHGVSMK
jgi:predicted amidohydrolase YtcJ